MLIIINMIVLLYVALPEGLIFSYLYVGRSIHSYVAINLIADNGHLFTARQTGLYKGGMSACIYLNSKIAV